MDEFLLLEQLQPSQYYVDHPPKSLEHGLVHSVQIHTVREWRNLSQPVLKFKRLIEHVLLLSEKYHNPKPLTLFWQHKPN